ncbi:MAG: hypothetical protein HXY43_14490 [Fischerella sp.]|uniref:hypothetical protein n=1 Tax=unclassified Fischerella TaxID=494603 RepID=UPI0012DD71EE|nr:MULTISPECIES: hypothetical protein [unclassified Fischerella]NWF60428.1 hypothetical protein [Fischerella sp.]
MATEPIITNERVDDIPVLLKIRMGNAPANLSILRAIAINILRRNGHTSITTAQRFL